MFTDTYTPQINGVVTSIQAFRAELERQGHEVHIFAPSSPFAKRKSAGGKGAISFHAEKNVHRIRSFTFAPYPEYKVSIPNPDILDQFERIHADIIHIHTPITMGLLGLGLARHFNLPTVGTFHTLLPEYMHYLVKGGLQKLLMKPAQRFAWNWCRRFYNRCDSVIAPSQATARLLKQKGVSKPIRIIPTGISITKPVGKRTAAVFRKKYKLHGKVLLHVGRVTREKNIETIIDAVAKIQDARLAIASDGPHLPELKKYAERKSLGGRVRFLGYLSKRELATAYAAADLFVCASKSETQGIVLLEAAVSALPIVALDAPVVSDFIRENRVGIISNELDFARKILSALNDTKLHSRVSSRAKAIAQKYSIERCAKELVNLYELCIDNVDRKKA
jgi:glycosyltransferase involved in cell wall biosynthesis